MAKRMIAFKGARTRVLSEGYPARGIYQILVKETASEDTYDLIRGEAVACFVPQEDGSFVANQDMIGKEIRVGLTMPDGTNEEWDEWRASEIKGSLLAVGVYSQHAQQAGVPLQSYLDNLKDGQFEFDVDWFAGQTRFVVFDPPPRGYKNNKGKTPLPETNIIAGGPNGGAQNAQLEFNNIATGKKKITWPFDVKLANAQRKAAQGNQPTGAGSMLGAAGTPPGAPGAPGPAPGVPTPGAPGAPQPGGAAVAPGAPTPTLPGAQPTVAPAAPAGPTNGLSPMPGGGAPGAPGAPGAGSFGPPAHGASPPARAAHGMVSCVVRATRLWRARAREGRAQHPAVPWTPPRLGGRRP